MKGIVVEIDNNEAVILTDSGLFTKVKDQNYAVGQTIKIQESRKTYSKLAMGAASMAAAFAVCTIGAYAWFTPTDYVSLDVNPSVEYSLNTFDRILEVKGVNEDGEKILEGLDLKNMTIEDAVKETLDQLLTDGYLTDDSDGGVVIATSNDQMGDAEKLAAELEQEVQAYLDEQKGITAKVDAEAVAPARVAEAKDLGVTPGKLNLVEKLQASTTGAINMEEWLKRPVKEINKAIKENRKAEKNNEEEIDRPDREDIDAEDGIDPNRKPEKQGKERPNGKDRADDWDGAAVNDRTQWDGNGRSSQEDNDRNTEKRDREDWKTNEPKNDEQKADRKTDKDESDNGRPSENGGRQGGGNSSGEDDDQDD